MTVVLLPDEFGDLAVCDLAMLVEAITRGDDLDDAMLDAAFDTINPRADKEAVRRALSRVRAVNASDDAEYWEVDK